MCVCVCVFVVPACAFRKHMSGGGGGGGDGGHVLGDEKVKEVAFALSLSLRSDVSCCC